MTKAMIQTHIIFKTFPPQQLLHQCALMLHEVVDAVEYMVKRNQKNIGTDEGETQHIETLLCVFSNRVLRSEKIFEQNISVFAWNLF